MSRSGTNIIKRAISTEKSIKLIETENKLIFLVELSASKKEIKKELEELFKAKVQRVNTVISPKGEKRAIVTFSETTPAIDIATKLGLM